MLGNETLVQRVFNIDGLGKRLPWIDFAKGVAIIAVVYRHILFGLEGAGLNYSLVFTNVSLLIESIRMPLFFILSGVFVRRSLMKKDDKEFVVNKLQSMMYPYFVWTFIQVTIQIAFGNYTNSSRGLEDYLYIFYLPRAIDHFWFIYALFAVSIVFMLLFRVFKGNKLILALVGLVLYGVSPWVHISIIEDVCRYLIFFVMGDLLATFISDSENKKKIASPYFTVFFLVFFSIGQGYVMSLDGDVNHFLLAIISLAGSFLTINIGFLVGGARTVKFIRVIGFHSMYIYIMHVLVAGTTRAVLMKIIDIQDPYIILFIVTLISVVFPIVFYNLTKKHLYFLFSMKKGVSMA